MLKIKFYVGTKKHNDVHREYFVCGDKVLRVAQQDIDVFPDEYGAFQELVRAGKAPEIDDSGEALVIVEEKPKPKAKSKLKKSVSKIFSKKEKKK